MPLVVGSALFVGYAAVSWRRQRRRLTRAAERPSEEDVAPFSSRLEHVPEQEAMDLELDRASDRGDDAPQSNEHASEYASDIRALFIARVTEALSPFPADRHAERRAGKAG
jgi:hypothetical protein